MKRETVGYIVTIDGQPAGWQPKHAHLHFVGPHDRTAAFLFPTREEAKRAIEKCTAGRLRNGWDECDYGIRRVWRKR